MPDNEHVESFTLGIVIAVLAYFFFEKKFGGRGRGAVPNGAGSSGAASTGCSCGTTLSQTPQNPIPLGAESFNRELPFPQQTVISRVTGGRS